jgi:hypothetical protein
MAVATDWLWSYLTYPRGARLDHRARQCDRRDLYRIEAITDRNFRFPMGATVVNGDTAASGAVSAKGNHPMNRNLFFDPIALRANAVPVTVES